MGKHDWFGSSCTRYLIRSTHCRATKRPTLADVSFQLANEFIIGNYSGPALWVLWVCNTSSASKTAGSPLEGEFWTMQETFVAISSFCSEHNATVTGEVLTGCGMNAKLLEGRVSASRICPKVTVPCTFLK
jgi:hypothetical protein